MREIGAFEAKTRTAGRGRGGQSITITRRGTPVARRVPVAAAPARAEALRRLSRQDAPLTRAEILPACDEGRR